MKQNNIKLLTLEQLNKLKDMYYFNLNESGTKVIVGNTHYKRETYHPINENFSLNSKIRIVTITKEAIQIWIKLKKKYNLFDIQQVVYILSMMSQEVTTTLVKKLLDNNILDRLES